MLLVASLCFKKSDRDCLDVALLCCFRPAANSCLTLRPHGLQHASSLCPPLSLGVHSNSCPLSQWWHPTISSSVVPFCLSFSSQSFPASGSFPMNLLFTSGGQSIGASASASVLPMNIQDWFPLGWTGLISLQPKGLSRVFSSTTQTHEFFSAQPSLRSNSHICTWLLEKLHGYLPAKWRLLLFKMLSRFVIAFLPRSKRLLISWLQSPSTVILEPRKIKSVTASTFYPSATKWWDQMPWTSFFECWVSSQLLNSLPNSSPGSLQASLPLLDTPADPSQHWEKRCGRGPLWRAVTPQSWQRCTCFSHSRPFCMWHWLGLTYEHLVCAHFLIFYGNAINVPAPYAGIIRITGMSGLGCGIMRRRLRGLQWPLTPLHSLGRGDLSLRSHSWNSLCPRESPLPDMSGRGGLTRNSATLPGILLSMELKDPIFLSFYPKTIFCSLKNHTGSLHICK